MVKNEKDKAGSSLGEINPLVITSIKVSMASVVESCCLRIGRDWRDDDRDNCTRICRRVGVVGGRAESRVNKLGTMPSPITASAARSNPGHPMSLGEKKLWSTDSALDTIWGSSERRSATGEQDRV